MAERISTRALNRALLDRQLLLRRSAMPVPDAIEHLIGLQSQAPNPPYIGLWTRLVGFEPDQLTELIVQRKAVRIALMRGTVHLVSARDCLLLRPLLQPLFERAIGVNKNLAPGPDDLDLDTLAAEATKLLTERPRTPKEIGTLLRERWRDREATALAFGARNRLALVQVPPRGLWGKSGQTTLTTAEHWLDRPLVTNPRPDEVMLRYLRAFGPGIAKDAQVWSGLVKLGEVVDRLRPRLRAYVDDQGRELLDLPDLARPDEDEPAPVRFLPEYDNLLRSHVERSRVLPPEYKPLLATKNDAPMPTFLVDGFVRGTWRLTTERDRATLRVTPFAALSTAETAAVTTEAERLLEFLVAGANGRDLRIDQPPG
ncbi:MAG TPA: winged helix DNA-binding domain-containing protein [Actinomycetes bacterium]|nr:winged helix DNA-binding domain-containing protein [Actinomycetes bacterium]